MGVTLLFAHKMACDGIRVVAQSLGPSGIRQTAIVRYQILSLYLAAPFYTEGVLHEIELLPMEVNCDRYGQSHSYDTNITQLQ